MNAQGAFAAGRDAEAMRGRSIRDIYAEADAAAILEGLEELFRGREPGELTVCGHTAGMRVTMRMRGVGEHAVLILNDVSDRRLAQALLENSEREFRSLFELASVGMVQVDTDTEQFLRVNSQYCAITGFTAEELYTTCFSELTHPLDREPDLQRYRSAIEDGTDRWSSEKRYVHKEGRVVWVQVDGTIVRDETGRPVRTIATVQDITARKEANAALRQSNLYLKEILESITDAFYAVDADLRFTYVNEQAERMWRKRRADILGKTILEAFPELLGSDTYARHLEAAEKRKGDHYETISPVIRIWIEVHIFPTHQGLAVCFRDISDRKQREAERQYVMKSARCLLWSSDVEVDGSSGKLAWTLRFFDQEAAQRLVPIDSEPGDPYIWKWHSLRFPEDRQENYRRGDESVRAGADFQVEFRIRDRDSRVHWIREEIHVETLEPGRRWRTVGVCTDVTEQKERLAEIQKLNERLRRSMSETHHRVKNNLQIVSAMLDMQHMEYEDVVPIAEVDRVRTHIRALSTIHDLLTQQAKTDRDMNFLSSRAALDKLHPMLQSMIPRERQIHFKVDDVPVPVLQSTALAILVNELVSNAIKHGKGNISVLFLVHPQEVELSVSDEGTGFPVDFDRDARSSTGLELVSSLARWDLNGQLFFENTPHGGARVRVAFPKPRATRTEGEL